MTLVRADTYEVSARASALPRDVRAAIAHDFGESQFRMASEDEPYSSGCVYDPILPRQRLLLAAVSPRFAVVHEEIADVFMYAEAEQSAAAFVVAGDLLQMGHDTPRYELEDAEKAYLRALEINSEYAAALSSLGYFYDAVLDDPARALRYFERAVALGCEAAREGLASVRKQLSVGRA